MKAINSIMPKPLPLREGRRLQQKSRSWLDLIKYLEILFGDRFGMSLYVKF